MDRETSSKRRLKVTAYGVAGTLLLALIYWAVHKTRPENSYAAFVSPFAQIRSMSADVHIEISPGADVEEFLVAEEKHFDWLKTQGENDVEAARKSARKHAASLRLRGTHDLHFAVERGKHLRIDRPVEELGRNSVSVFADGQWITLLDPDESKPPGEMTISQSEPINWERNFEFARGAGVSTDTVFINQELANPPLREFGQTVSWSELGRVLGPAMIATDDAGRRCLEAATTPVDLEKWYGNKAVTLGHFRIRTTAPIFQAPSSLEVKRAALNLARPDQLLDDLKVEWSDPFFAKDGSMIYKTCEMHSYSHSIDCSVPSVGKALALKAYHTMTVKIEFSNIALNQPFDRLTFVPTPLVGTEVIDFVNSERYIVGKGGEKLDRIEFEDRSLDRGPASPFARHWGAILLNLAAFAGLASILAIRKFRNRSPSTAS